MTQFDFLSEEPLEAETRFSAKPKKKDDQISDLQIVVDRKAKLIKEIGYTDDLGNKTRMIFSDVQLEKKSKTADFEYSPPKDVEVTDL